SSSRDRIAITAFAGWNDAGGAATDAVEHLAALWEAELVAEQDPEDYYDFQVMRPRFIADGTGRELLWPKTRAFLAETPDQQEILLIDGIEPSMRWREFTAELLALFDEFDVGLLISVGALLADVPHTRPIPVTATSASTEVRIRYGVERSDYTGPTGIVGVLEHLAFHDEDLPSMSLWAAVPHYVVASPPSPKAVIAILNKLGELLDEDIDLGDLPNEAVKWQESIDSMAEEDRELAGYIAQLEAAKDAVDSPEASGEALAREFQRFLEGHHGKNPGDPSPPGRPPKG
ncbi:MAG: PAC2 family protein, partial [Micrococcales bacterium]|nr:PAC2 family protein [Micrococcales bacterium]